MKLSAKEFEDLVKEVAGNDTVKLVPMLWNKRNVSEFLIAEKLRLTINIVRNMLYRLHEHNLVMHTRKKDKKKGWYIYYWTINPSNARSMLFSVKQRRLRLLRNQLEYEKAADILYTCPNNCTRLQVQDAIEQDYKCMECGRVLQEEANGHALRQMQQEIEHLERQLDPASEGFLKQEPRATALPKQLKIVKKSPPSKTRPFQGQRTVKKVATTKQRKATPRKAARRRR